ncbi:MAG: hypothetical protein IPK52_03735 [Chloroflexi bacterium]|nr:hypothetical protein [Chloroflexota bacterium]
MGWLNRFHGVTLTFVLVLIAGGVLFVAAQDSTEATFQQALRADIETLANESYGSGTRPETWTGNTDPATPNFLADAFYDNEQLADRIFGLGVRPDEWFGASSPSPALIFRNVRHDLELSATEFFGGQTTRPTEWVGADASLRCDRALQDVLLILNRDYNIQPTSITQVIDYCTVVKAEVEDRIFGEVLDELSATAVTPELIGGLRGDLERLADERLGLETRPDGWIGNRVDGSPTFISDVFIDLDTLADNELGLDIRPVGWIGAISASPLVSYRSLRFDIETLADATLGEGVRPRGWQGTDPLTRCETTLQTLVTLLTVRFPNFTSVIDPNQPSNEVYCQQVFELTIQTAEAELQNDELLDTVDSSVIFESQNAFSYLDVAALDYMGVMPWETEFRPWFRNFQESNMMFVTGEGFALFVDRRWTTMPEEAFVLLPNLEGRKPRTFCDATWCNGPQPTPTPTGSGPIIALFEAATPVSTNEAAPTGPIPTNKMLVTWNNIRVTYLVDNAATRTVQVALEICAEAAQVTCEPVLTVYDGNNGLFRPVIQQYNGLNVFEMGYGYQTNVILEGATRYSRDIFISEPGLR